MANSRWQDIYNHLKGLGYDVYAPAKKTGDCKNIYVVVRGGGISGMSDYSSTIALYDILVYIPFGQYTKIEPTLDKLKKDLDALFPMLQTTDVETPPYSDDTVKGYMVSLQYKNYRKKERA